MAGYKNNSSYSRQRLLDQIYLCGKVQSRTTLALAVAKGSAPEFMQGLAVSIFLRWLEARWKDGKRILVWLHANRQQFLLSRVHYAHFWLPGWVETAPVEEVSPDKSACVNRSQKLRDNEHSEVSDTLNSKKSPVVVTCGICVLQDLW